VYAGIGGDGVVGVLVNGDGPTLLLRADMDALPVREETALDYASTATGTDADGNRLPVMHACGHYVHVSCLLGAAHLLAGGTDAWRRTLVPLFQPAEEAGDGARGERHRFDLVIGAWLRTVAAGLADDPAGQLLAEQLRWHGEPPLPVR
jgi:metal-dependent amidase/aminoacylase/carboxypeptidase family protein